jgi:hypothetical protein
MLLINWDRAIHQHFPLFMLVIIFALTFKTELCMCTLPCLRLRQHRPARRNRLRKSLLRRLLVCMWMVLLLNCSGEARKTMSSVSLNTVDFDGVLGKKGGSRHRRLKTLSQEHRAQIEKACSPAEALSPSELKRQARTHAELCFSLFDVDPRQRAAWARRLAKPGSLPAGVLEKWQAVQSNPQEAWLMFRAFLLDNSGSTIEAGAVLGCSVCCNHF